MKRVALIVLAIFLLSFSMTLAEEGMMGGGMGMMGNSDMMCMSDDADAMHEEMGISAEKREELKKMRDEYRKEHKSIMEEIKKARDEMKVEYKKDNSDKAKLNELNTKISGLLEEMGASKIEHMLAIKGIIGADKFKKMMDKKMEMGEKHKTKMKKMMEKKKKMKEEKSEE